MYLVRRTYKVKPGKHREAAELMVKICRLYEQAGQRGPARVYWSGQTVPGTANQVYMDWVTEKLESPYREGNVAPAEAAALSRQLAELREDTWIEFFQMSPAWKGP
jgi:hypothetical protein